MVIESNCDFSFYHRYSGFDFDEKCCTSSGSIAVKSTVLAQLIQNDLGHLESFCSNPPDKVLNCDFIFPSILCFDYKINEIYFKSVLCSMINPFTDEYFMRKALQEAEMAFEKAKFC
jgi:hypothetical protein